MIITEGHFENLDLLKGGYDLRIKKGILYKKVSYEFADRIKFLYKNKKNPIFENFVLPSSLIYSIESFSLFGYTMPYYSEYNTLYEARFLPYNYEERITICKKIIDSLKSISKLGCVYGDIHSGNFMCLKDDLKIIDVESIMLGNEDCNNYDNLLKEKERVLYLVFSHLLDIDYNSLYKEELRYLPISKEFQNYINACTNGSSSIISTYPDEYIDELDEEKIKVIRRIIK